MALMSRPPHGGRGLKYSPILKDGDITLSSPSRGTWIEIDWTILFSSPYLVVPLTGDVD